MRGRRGMKLGKLYLMINKPDSISSNMKKSMLNLWTLRIDSMVLVGQFSRFMKITLGGLPNWADKFTKSLSLVTIEKSFVLAISQISLSFFSRHKWNTWVESGYSLEKTMANCGDKLASNKSFKELIISYFDQPQRLAQPVGLLG